MIFPIRVQAQPQGHLYGVLILFLICIDSNYAWTSWSPQSKIATYQHSSISSPLSSKIISCHNPISCIEGKRKHHLPSSSTRLFVKEGKKIQLPNGKPEEDEPQSQQQTSNVQVEIFPNEEEETTLWQSIQENVFLGIEPTPEIFAIMSIYFVEGALGLARLAQTFYLKDTLHLGPAELSALTGLFTLPWTIKPLYGFISDGVPLFGYRRRSYLILCGILGAFTYTALGNSFGGIFDVAVNGGDAVMGGITMIQATIASFVISSGCIAFSDVVADGIVVQRTRDSNDPKVAGTFIAVRKCYTSIHS